MAAKVTYKVLRRLDGDQLYNPGDTREMTEIEAKHLVALGVLERVDGKAADAPANKAEASPPNKAETAHKAKKAKG